MLFLLIGTLFMAWAIHCMLSGGAETGINKISKTRTPLLFYAHVLMWLVFGICMIIAGVLSILGL
jgi:hypothetical protein